MMHVKIEASPGTTRLNKNSILKISISLYKIPTHVLGGLSCRSCRSPMIRARESKSAPVGVVVKVLKILEAIHDAPAGLQLKQVAKQTAINKSTAYRFLAHLEGEGYLYRDDAGAYVIGPKLARLGSGINYEESLRKISRPILHKLWITTGETVNLSVLDGQEVLYLDVIESSHTFRLASQVGSRRPLYCTSLGKAAMAFLPP